MLSNTVLKINGKELRVWFIAELIQKHLDYKKGVLSLEEFYNDFKDLKCYQITKPYDENIEFIESNIYNSKKSLKDDYNSDLYLYVKDDIKNETVFKEYLKYLNCYHIKDIQDFKDCLDWFDKKEKENYLEFYQDELNQEDYYLGYCYLEDVLFSK